MVGSKDEEIKKLEGFIKHKLLYGLKEDKEELIKEDMKSLFHGLKHNIPSQVLRSYAEMYILLPTEGMKELAEYIGKIMERHSYTP